MISNKTVPEEIVFSWESFCATAAGRLMPMNFIRNEAGFFIVGHECADTDLPITCTNGQIVRSLALSFSFESQEIVWS